MRPTITSIVLAVVAALLFVVGLAWAGTPTERLRTFFTETNAIIRDADPKLGTDACRTTLRALVNDVFDFSGAAARALGPEWLGRTPHEQEEFVRLFADLLERGYVAMLGSKVRLRGGLSINFVGESVRGDSATVTTTMLTRVGTELPVSYRLGRHGARWAVQDVEIDGVSLVRNYRAQFRRVLQASSYGELVAQMRDKVLDSPRTVTASEAPPAQPAGTRTVAADAPALPLPLPTAAPTATTIAPIPAPALPVIAPEPPASREEQVPALSPEAPGPAVTPPEPLTAPKSEVTAPIEPPAAPRSPEPAPRPADDPRAVAPPRAEPRGATPSGRPGEPGTSAAAPKTRSAIKTTPAARVRYWVQLGAFQTADAASRLADRLRSRVANVSTTTTAPTASDPAALARVLVGPFAKRAHAVAKLRELEKRGYRGFIVTELRDP